MLTKYIGESVQVVQTVSNVFAGIEEYSSESKAKSAACSLLDIAYLLCRTYNLLDNTFSGSYICILFLAGRKKSSDCTERNIHDAS